MLTRFRDLVVQSAEATAPSRSRLGYGVSQFAAKVLATLLFGVSLRDPVTYLGVAAAGLANYVPARRAARVEPMRALRTG